MATTWLEQGEERGQRALLRLQLEARFGSLPPESARRLQEWPKDRLPELGLALMHNQSLKELGLED